MDHRLASARSSRMTTCPYSTSTPVACRILPAPAAELLRPSHQDATPGFPAVLRSTPTAVNPAPPKSMPHRLSFGFCAAVAAFALHFRFAAHASDHPTEYHR